MTTKLQLSNSESLFSEWGVIQTFIFEQYGMENTEAFYRWHCGQYIYLKFDDKTEYVRQVQTNLNPQIFIA